MKHVRTIALGLPLLLGACGETSPPTDPPNSSPATDPSPAGQEIFREAAADTGLDFQHQNGMSGAYYFVEITGSGAALFDYDNDGDLDLYLVQGTPLPSEAGTEASTDRLFRNESVESGQLGWTDVTEDAGTLGSGYGIGVATGDIDNDGFVDLYVTQFENNQLLRNRGDGTFEDVTEATGTDDARWSTSASFADLDQDGWLDLYVANYVNFTLANHEECYSSTSARDYCGPLSYEPYPDRLFRNLGRGDGASRFEDISAPSGILGEYGGALGVVVADFNGDRRPDVYVANDGTANQLWTAVGEGRFENQALLAGCAYNQDGKAEASMGVVAGDVDGDGDEDLFMTHLTDETNTLYLNDGQGLFTDHTAGSGLGSSSHRFTGFGTAWLDYDNDGWLDLMVVNGAVKTITELARQGDPFPLHQRNQLLHNLGGTRFEEISGRAGSAFDLSEVSRGAAFGDVDNDGDTDVVVSNNHGPVRLLLNQVGQDRSWLGLRLRDAETQRDAYGAQVRVDLDDGRTLVRRVGTDGSYGSANDPRILLGLGEQTRLQEVTVTWPGGAEETWDFSARALGTYHTLVRGEGGVTGP